MKKIIFFDLDGTIKNKGNDISENIYLAFKDLWKRNVFTTLNTGQNYHSLNYILKKNIKKIIHPSLPIGLENGAKGVWANGEIFYTKKFKNEELDFLIDFVKNNLNKISFLAFSNGEKIEKSKIFVLDDNFFNSVNERYSKFYEIQTFNLSIFVKEFLKDSPGMLSIRPKEVIDLNSFPYFEAVRNEGYVNIAPKGVNKALFVNKISEFLNLDYSSIAVCGNDENDFSMFELNVLKKIFVLSAKKREEIVFDRVDFCDEPDLITDLLEDI